MGGMGGMFGIFLIFFGITFIAILGVIVFIMVQSATQWNKNNHSPVLTVEARVVAKREKVSYSNSHHGRSHHGRSIHHHSSSSTSYYTTFEFESGDRLELRIPYNEFGYLVEGDMGRLTFQGTRYHGFERYSEAPYEM
jgi:hypothetical protein